MKAFAISLLLIAAISAVAALGLNAVDMSAKTVYSTSSTRF